MDKIEVANPLLQSFGKPPKACVSNSSRPLANVKVKGNSDLPSVWSIYWHPIVALSLCFNHFILLAFQKCRFEIPPEICQALSQYPPHSTDPLRKSPNYL